MLAPPQARRIGPGGAATRKEAVNTHSNARFGGEVEWNMSGTTTFFSTAVCREVSLPAPGPLSAGALLVTTTMTGSSAVA